MIDSFLSFVTRHPLISKMKEKDIMRSYGEINIRIYYLREIFENAFFIAGSWLAYWLKFMNGAELGIIDAVTFGASVLFEVPSGAIADLFGKRKTIILGHIAKAIGIGFMTFGDNKYIIFLGMFLMLSIGGSLTSGAGEALVYDTLVEKQKESYYDKVISNIFLIKIFATVGSTAIGSLLYLYNDRLPWIIWFIGSIIAVILTIKLYEPNVETIKFSIKNYLLQQSTGFKQVFHSKIRIFLPALIALGGIFYAFEWGLVWPSVAYTIGFDAVMHGYEYAVITLISSIFVFKFTNIKSKLGNTKGLYLLLIVMGLAFLGLGFKPSLYFGGFLLLLIGITGNLASPWTSSIVNRHIKSQYRATALSVVALFTKIPYVIIALYAGQLLEKDSILVICSIFGTVLLAALALSFISRKLYSR